jgi:hypothetical protein
MMLPHVMGSLAPIEVTRGIRGLAWSRRQLSTVLHRHFVTQAYKPPETLRLVTYVMYHQKLDQRIH